LARAQTARPWASVQGFDPFRVLFKLFTSVRFAIVMVLIVAVAALLGVIFPQAPDPVRLSPQAYDAWMEIQRGRYGVFAEPMRALGLFAVFHSVWFNGLFFVLLAAVAICTANRFMPTWRSVRRPLRRVNDRYFEHAHARASVETGAGPEAVERLLRKHRYKVERVAERDGAVYLFADRFSWAQLATFVTHLSLILFMAGGIVSKLVGFNTSLLIPDGRTQPVFPVVHANQMQVLNVKAVEGRDAQGNIVDFHSDLVIYQNGREICRGTATVNDPLRCNGYTFHQAAFNADGVALRVRDTKTGAVVYDEALPLSREPASPSPRVVVRDSAGKVLFDDFLVMAPIDDRKSIAVVPAQGMSKPLFAAVYRSTDTEPWKLSLIHLRDQNDPNDQDFQVTAMQGQTVSAGGLEMTFADLRGLPQTVVQGIPGITAAALLQLSTDADGKPVLDMQDLAGQNPDTARTILHLNQPVVAGNYEYTLEGTPAFTGILVRRDPGSWFIWVATALMLGGLTVTFWVPRRRLWAKVTPERVFLAGIAERTAHLSEELERLLRELPAAPALVVP
jgi:cytochrome c biogenesis protein ResB